MKRSAIVFALILVIAGLSCQSKQEGEFLVLGKSQIVVPARAIVGTQVDRVIRDVNCPDSKYGENDDPFRVPNGGSGEFVSYMEGRLTQILKQYADIREVGLTPTYAKLKDGRYFASDGNGGFAFEINNLRINEYRTVMFSPDKKTAILPDTHGFHMVAGQAYRLSQFVQLGLVMACMDQPAKAEAALYLARNGISCYAPCDRYAPLLMGYKNKFPDAAVIIGSAPIRRNGNTAVIGNQPIRINLREKIVVQNSILGYPDQYCDTPARYFRSLNENLHLKLDLEEVLANVGETEKLTEKARRTGASVIAVRIHNRQDQKAIAQWLSENSDHRAVLLHSAAYEPGYEMYFLFPGQTSFGDLCPVIE